MEQFFSFQECNYPLQEKLQDKIITLPLAAHTCPQDNKLTEKSGEEKREPAWCQLCMPSVRILANGNYRYHLDSLHFRASYPY